MAKTFSIDPVTRLEGHLKIEVTVETVGGVQQVIDARSAGTMFRGFENILVGRDPLDAPHITQRICGVCPVSHGMAASLNLENAFGQTPPANGRILRNLILGANFIQSHILHFYHLAALDYINTQGILDMPPWSYRYVTPDMVTGTLAQTLVSHYVQALDIRRKAHQMAAVFGGKLPCPPTFAPGGCTEIASADKIAAYRALLNEIKTFIDTVFLPDIETLAQAFSAYYQIGRGSGKLLAYGVFDLNDAGSVKLFRRGIYNGSAVEDLNTAAITEDVSYSWYSSPSHLHPSVGQTATNAYKTGAYSWNKAPRYNNQVYELGPLARMWINGDYTNGISAMDRIAARALETQKVAYALDGWLNQLTVGAASYAYALTPESAVGMGLTEAPRGALGHWISIADKKISRYQVITPTAWNASPMDDSAQKGPLEQALIGTPVADETQPVEVLRVVHSFDPCLACSVHLMRPDQKKLTAVNSRTLTV